MANHPSAEKRNRQRINRSARALAVRSATRTAVKKARQAVESGEQDAAEAVHQASVALAKAAKKGVLHVRTAARTTARINSALHKRSAAE
jgi:small subunit ribosomal protein S20